VTLVIDSQA